MWFAARAKKFDGRRKREITRNFLPDEMESVVGIPDVFTAACDSILAIGIDFHHARLGDIANISLVGKYSEFGRISKSSRIANDKSCR